MKLAYFSPLSPIKSGISEYSEKELLPYIGKHCDIEIIIDKKYEPTNKKTVSKFKIINYERYDGKSDKILYHMGNNPFHKYIYEFAIKKPGIVVLHDPYIHHLIRHITVGQKNSERYIQLMAYCLGPKGRVIAENALISKDFPLFDYPMIKELGDSSEAIVVHSDFAENIVKKECPDVLIKKINMPISIPTLSKSEKLRSELNISEKSIVIGTFGNISFYKRLNVALKAFSHFLKKNPDAVFLIVGMYLNDKYEKEIHELIESLRIRNNVIETGYVEDLFPYIQISDIAIQLRYPTAGETSIITLQIMGVGKPVIVSNIGSFTEIPNNSVIKINPDVKEEVSVYNEFLKITNDSIYKESLSDNAKKYIIEKHDPEKIASELFKFILDVPKKEHKKIILPEIITNETPKKSNLEIFSEEEINVGELELKNPNTGNRLIRKLRILLHNEIRDWIVRPFQKKQTKFNRKVAQSITTIKTKTDSVKADMNSVKADIRKLVEESLKLDKAIENTIHFNLDRRIDNIIESKISSIREIFEIENQIKEKYLKVLNRLPNDDELRLWVIKVKKGEIKIDELEKNLIKE